MIRPGTPVWVDDLTLNDRRVTGVVESFVDGVYRVRSGKTTNLVDTRRVTPVLEAEVCVVAEGGWLVEAQGAERIYAYVEEMLP